MGAELSVRLEDLSAEDVGSLVASIGKNYLQYQELIVENGFSGDILAHIDDAELKTSIQSIGVTNVAHLNILCAHVKKLKSTLPNPSPAPDRSLSERRFHSIPPSFEVGDRVTLTPRAIMSRLFEIQGIAVDPMEVDPAGRQVAQAVGGDFGDGETKYDCFINYRQATDADLAEKLFYYLRSVGIHAFLDKKCLKNGEGWKEGFLRALTNSKCFLALISRRALDRVRDQTEDHTNDHVLLEYETALKIMDVTENPKFVVPLHVGEYNDGKLAKFRDFSVLMYPDSVTAIVPLPPLRKANNRRRVIISSAKNPSKCIHLSSGTDNGMGVHLWTQLPNHHPHHLNQEWIVDFDKNEILSAKDTSKGIHLESSAHNGAKVHLWEQVVDNQNQKWFFETNTRGSFLLLSAKDKTKCLQLESDANDGSKVHLWSRLAVDHCHHLNQEWILTDV